VLPPPLVLKHDFGNDCLVGAPLLLSLRMATYYATLNPPPPYPRLPEIPGPKQVDSVGDSGFPSPLATTVDSPSAPVTSVCKDNLFPQLGWFFFIRPPPISFFPLFFPFEISAPPVVSAEGPYSVHPPAAFPPFLVSLSACSSSRAPTPSACVFPQSRPSFFPLKFSFSSPTLEYIFSFFSTFFLREIPCVFSLRNAL